MRSPEYERGVKDAMKGAFWYECPYKGGSVDAYEWLKGHDSIKRVRPIGFDAEKENLMTQPDIYTVEARERIAKSFDDEGMVANSHDIRVGCWREREVAILAATLRELNWQPPVDPDLVEARSLVDLHGFISGGSVGHLALAAIKRGRELAATERGA